MLQINRFGFFLPDGFLLGVFILIQGNRKFSRRGDRFVGYEPDERLLALQFS